MCSGGGDKKQHGECNLIFLGLTSDFQITQVCNWMLNQDSTISFQKFQDFSAKCLFIPKKGMESHQDLQQRMERWSNICFAILISSPSLYIKELAQNCPNLVCLYAKEWFYGKNASMLLTLFYLEELISSLHEPRGSSRDKLKNFTYVSSWLNEDSFISTPEKAKRQEMVAREQT